MAQKARNFYKLILLILLIFVVGGTAGVIGERFVMPWLLTFPSLENVGFIKKANEKVTIINQTKEITVKEDFSVANIAEKVSPSVVSIISFQEDESEKAAKTNQIKASQDIQKNVKTGMILTSDGLIVGILDETIREIVKADSDLEESAESLWKFKILIGNGQEFNAKILAVDEFSNLVFYKAEESDLPIPNLGDSANIEVGEKVVICGNAGGEYQNSFSSGLIKEKDRTFTLLNSELSSSEKLEGAILLDAKIEDRNVGGPVVDYNGSVIGIVNRIEKDGEKIGFVIPIDGLKPIIDKVMKKEELKNPSLGVYYLSINREIALLNNLTVDQGALIYSFSGQQGLAVIKDSAADQAGIEIGDIIIAVDNKSVDLQNPLSQLIIQHQSGDEVEIRLIREEERMNLNVILK
ncbi:MAG: serine protease [Candidatus Moranbacteria bacterium]|nr:serine protease [Candidatus Moranbacteria bacterium]